MADLLALAEQDVRLRRVSATNGAEYAGPCPGCGGRDRFRLWPSKARWWCRQCGKRGDAIEYLRAFHGLSFAEAKRFLGLDTTPPARGEIVKRHAHKAALQAAREAYALWAHHKMVTTTDEYRELSAEIEIAEIAYRLLCRRPDLFSDEDAAYWLRRLGRLYDRQAVIADEADIVTYQQYEQELFMWWREEVKSGRITVR